MLVSATEMLNKAKAGHYAVGQFNINNLEWTKAILQTAQELNSPVILGVSEGAGKYMTGYKTVVGMVNGMLEESEHHRSRCSASGSRLIRRLLQVSWKLASLPSCSMALTIRSTRTLKRPLSWLRLLIEKGVSIEAEVGAIGGEEDGVIGMGECADPNECKRIADLGVDFLAAGIGNIHGKYPANWKGLSALKLWHAIQQLTGDLPLVLHGGTGIPADMIKKAIALGVC